MTFSEKFACPVSGFTIPEIEPRLFSFNAPFGACPIATAWGWNCSLMNDWSCRTQTLKIYDGALAPWRKGKSPYFLQTIEAIAKHYEFNQQHQMEGLARHCAASVPLWVWRGRNPIPL